MNGGKAAEVIAQLAKGAGRGVLDAVSMGAGAVGSKVGLPAITDYLKTGKVNNLKNIATTSASFGVASGLVKGSKYLVQHNPDNILKYSISPLGAALAMGVVGVGGAKDVVDYQRQRVMGTVTPGVQELPNLQYDYDNMSSQDTGADGNLVFALNNLRNGG